VEKARKLEASRFAQFLLSQELSLKISRSSAEEPAGVTYVRPDDEAVDAFLLMFRFFVQNGNGISFRYLADYVYFKCREANSETVGYFSDSQDCQGSSRTGWDCWKCFSSLAQACPCISCTS